MSIIADSLRPFWLPGLNEVTGNIKVDLKSWISSGDYQIYNQINPNDFILSVTDNLPTLKAFACDCNKMSVASFESMEGIQPHPIFPRSMGWLIIRAYYSAFFAAHAIIKIFGTSCLQLDVDQALRINNVADAFGFSNGVKANQGYYVCEYDPKTKKLHFKKLDTSRGGSHEIMWKVFHDMLKQLGNNILQGPGIKENKEKVAQMIEELCRNITRPPCGLRAHWLSHIRNVVNYKHAYGTWFPYRDYNSYCDSLYTINASWKGNPGDITLSNDPKKDLKRFMETVSLIVSICKNLVDDMSIRCTKGNSFFTYAPVAFLHQARIT